MDRLAEAVLSDGSFYGSRSQQVKFSVPSYQKFHILFLRYQVVQERIKTALYLR